MSVLIRGMEMPKACASCRIKRRNGKKMVCPLLDEEWDIHDPMSADHRLADCPLGHVPPHGRLVDADALLMRINHEGMEAYMDGACYGVHPSQEYLYLLGEIIDDAPTIIPAEPCSNLSKPCKEGTL